MDNELDRRLVRIEKGIEQLRDDMERQAKCLGTIIALMEVMAKPEEPEGAPLGPLLQRLLGRLDHITGLLVETLAGATKIGSSNPG
jgi:hypothetical protein